MDSGIYTAYSGMQAQADALEILANNLANINTPGFKEEKAFFTVLQQSLEAGKNQDALQSTVNRTVGVFSALNGKEGSLTNTHRDLDIAIEGNGFLVVQSQKGIRYTRNGSLNTNSVGVLTASDGSPILGIEGKPITLGPGKILIGEQGDVQLDGVTVDRLKVVRFENLSLLEKEGNSLFSTRSGRDIELDSDAKIKAGFLEESNVSPVEVVVQMISILRNFEATQKCMSLITNDIDKKAIENLSR